MVEWSESLLRIREVPYVKSTLQLMSSWIRFSVVFLIQSMLIKNYYHVVDYDHVFPSFYNSIIITSMTTYKIWYWKHHYKYQHLRTSKWTHYPRQQFPQVWSKAGISCANLSFYFRRRTWSFELGLERLGNTTSLWSILQGQTILTPEDKTLEFSSDNRYIPSRTDSTGLIWVSS